VGRQDNNEEVSHTTNIGFCILTQTRDVFTTAINIHKLEISQTNNERGGSKKFGEWYQKTNKTDRSPPTVLP
jgi:hypothetical protein